MVFLSAPFLKGMKAESPSPFGVGLFICPGLFRKYRIRRRSCGGVYTSFQHHPFQNIFASTPSQDIQMLGKARLRKARLIPPLSLALARLDSIPRGLGLLTCHLLVVTFSSAIEFGNNPDSLDQGAHMNSAPNLSTLLLPFPSLPSPSLPSLSVSICLSIAWSTESRLYFVRNPERGLSTRGTLQSKSKAKAPHLLSK